MSIQTEPGFFRLDCPLQLRERGWNELVKVPAQRWKSSELESFLQEDFYDHRTFGELIAEPLSFICVIPLLLLCVAAMIRQELAGEWRRLYEEMYGVEFAFHWGALWFRFREQIQHRKRHLFAGAKAVFRAGNQSPKESPLRLPIKGHFTLKVAHL